MPHPLEKVDFKGRQDVEPSVKSRYRVQERARFTGANPFVATLLAPAPAGPTTVGEFASLAEFLAVHDPEKTGSEAAVLAGFAFRPGPGNTLNGAPKVRFVRVGSGTHVPTPAAITLADATPLDVITLTSIDKGTHVNRLRVKVEANAGGGVDVSLGYKRWSKTGANLGPLFTLEYTGTVQAGGAVAAHLADGQFITVGTGFEAGTQAFTVDLASSEFPTVQSLVNYINRQPGYQATAIETDLPLSRLAAELVDPKGTTVISGAGSATFTSKGAAIAQWLNDNCSRIGPIPGVTATATVNALSPAAIDWTDFTGGTLSAVDQTDYDAALEALDLAEAASGILFLPPQADAADDAELRDAVQTWMDEQDALGRMWRAAFSLQDGDGVLTDAEVMRIAGTIDRTRVAGCFFQRILDISDPDTTHGPSRMAAAFAGATAGMVPATNIQGLVLTKKRLKAGGIYADDRRTKTQRERLILAGLNLLMEKNGGVILSLAITTTQGSTQDDNNRLRMMWSESVAIDILQRSVEEAIEPKSVAWATDDYVARVKAATRVQLEGWKTAGLITDGIDPETGDAVPAYSVPLVTVDDGVVTVAFGVGIAGEVDHARIDGLVAKVNLSSAA